MTPRFLSLIPFLFSVLIILLTSAFDNVYLISFQVVIVMMGELRSLYSQAWDNYAFLTHVARDPIAQDRVYRRLLHPRVGSSSSVCFNSDQSNPSVDQSNSYGF